MKITEKEERENKIYDEWKKFLDFWLKNDKYKMVEALLLYLSKNKK